MIFHSLVFAALVSLAGARSLSRHAPVDAAGSVLIRSADAEKHVPTTSPDSSCVDVHDQGSYLSIEIEVGTALDPHPPQKFEVVADTGSDSVIIPSCLCKNTMRCSNESRCFQGTNMSSSFSLFNNERPDQIPAVTMTFGSGQIESVIATDVVQVGTMKVNMSNSLLLMVDQALDVPVTYFEGIMGLGPPKESRRKVTAKHSGHLVPNIMSFLGEGNIQTFSICVPMDDQGNVGTGALRFGVPPQPDAMQSEGHAHWTIDLRGVSVNGGNPIGSGKVVPDSGTTLLMGPAKSVQDLFTSLCKAWPACANVGGNESEYITFQKVLEDCPESRKDMPKLTFHLGSGASTKDLSMTEVNYVMETEEDQLEDVTKHLGDLTIHGEKKTGQKVRKCIPAFGVMSDMPESGSEELWILGTPLFAKYKVTYNLNEKTIGFSEPCDVCPGSRKAARLFREQTSQAEIPRHRVLDRPARVSHIHDEIIKEKAGPKAA